MNKKTNLLFMTAIASFIAIGGALVVANNDIKSTLGLVEKHLVEGDYTLTLNEGNRINDDGSVFTSPLNNKIYFAYSGVDVNKKPDNAWLSFGNSSPDDSYVYNTTEIYGMNSITWITNNSSSELLFGYMEDEVIHYSNAYEFNGVDIGNGKYQYFHEFNNSHPAFFQIRGSFGNFTIYSVVINYSCSEGDPVILTELSTFNFIYDQNEDAYQLQSLVATRDEMQTLFIPGTYNDGIHEEKPVKDIGLTACLGKTNLEYLYIGEGVETIGNNSFNYCVKLSYLVLPSTITSIGAEAFDGCPDLSTMEVPAGMSNLDPNTYAGNQFIENITVAKGNQYYYADNGVLYAKNYNGHPDTLLVCPAGKEDTITVNNDCTYIYDGAFKNSKASTIHIGSDVELIDEKFNTCKSLTNFEVEAGNTHYSSNNGLLCDYMGSILYRYPRGRNVANVILYNISNDIRDIGDYAFYDNDTITILNASEVRSVGNEAFKNMDNVTSIALASLSSLGTSVFENDKKLTSAPLVNSITVIPDYTFKGCTSLSSFSFPLDLVEIGVSAFEGCIKLTDISFPVERNVALTIKSSAFKGCSSIGDISFVDHDNIELQGHVFENSGLTSITFNSTIASIPDSLCQNCDLLTEVSFPVNVKTIGYDAFNDCGNLATVEFVDYGVNTIYSKAFLNCNLDKVYLPESVTTIGASAFNQGKLIEVYTIISGEDDGATFDFVRKPGWDEHMCGAYYRLVCGDRAYYEKQP